MRYTLLLIALLFVAANADLRIDMVYYDPFNSRGSEAVLIHNTGANTIDLTGYRLATRTSPQDHTLQGIIAPFGTYLSTYTGWDEQKDNQSWPDADHQQPITLANAGGWVSLTTPEGEVLDTVGWGNTEVYLGIPHPGVQKGMALVRTQDTGNNSADFAELLPFTTQQQEGTTLLFDVLNTPPEIIHIAVEDDFPDREHVQLLPLTNGRHIWVNITVRDNNTLHSTTVTVNDVVLEGNTSATQTVFTGLIPITAQTTHLTVRVEDEEHVIEETLYVEILPAASIRVPDNVQTTIMPNRAANNTILIENTGGSAVNLHIKGTPPRRAQHLLGQVYYSINGAEYELQRDIREHEVVLAPGQQLSIHVRTTASFVPAGQYSGQIIIAGVLA